MKIEGSHYRIETVGRSKPVSYRAISQEDCKAWARGWAKPGPVGAAFCLYRVDDNGRESVIARFRAGTCKPEPRKPVPRIVKESLTQVKKNLLDKPWF